MKKQTYQIIGKKGSKKLAQFLHKEGQLLLPMLELITQAEMAVDELIDLTGRAAIEALLTLSVQEVAGPKHQGKMLRLNGFSTAAFGNGPAFSIRWAANGRP